MVYKNIKSPCQIELITNQNIKEYVEYVDPRYTLILWPIGTLCDSTSRNTLR
jgi:hypothetical protein